MIHEIKLETDSIIFIDLFKLTNGKRYLSGSERPCLGRKGGSSVEYKTMIYSI